MSAETVDPDAWMRDPDKLEQFFYGALKAGDSKSVEAALIRMALVDPDRAQRLYDDLKTALHIARGGAVEAQIRFVPAGGEHHG